MEHRGNEKIMVQVQFVVTGSCYDVLLSPEGTVGTVLGLLCEKIGRQEQLELKQEKPVLFSKRQKRRLYEEEIIGECNLYTGEELLLY